MFKDVKRFNTESTAGGGGESEKGRGIYRSDAEKGQGKNARPKAAATNSTAKSWRDAGARNAAIASRRYGVGALDLSSL